MNIFSGFLSTILLLIAQGVLFKHLVLFGTAFCFAYLLIFLLLPVDMNPVLQLLIGFAAGLLVDTFYHTWGMHAATGVGMVYLRIYWLRVVMPDHEDAGHTVHISVYHQGLARFVLYAFPLIFIYSLLLFFIETAGLHLFWLTLTKAFYSAVFTLFVLLIIQYLFYKN